MTSSSLLKNRLKLLIVLGHFFVICLPFFLLKDHLLRYSYFLYAAQCALFIADLSMSKFHIKSLFSPSFFTLIYFSFSFIGGAYVLPNRLGLLEKYSNWFWQYNYYDLTVVYFLISNVIVFFIFTHFRRRLTENYNTSNSTKQQIHLFTLVTASLLFLAMFFVEVDLGFLGASGSFDFTLKLACTIFIVNELTKVENVTLKFGLYGALLLLFISGSYDSKREILFVLILIGFMEMRHRNICIKLNLRWLLSGISVFVVVAVIILTSSIGRGYGEFDAKNVIEMITYIPDYVGSDLFKGAIVNNLELNYAYGNSTKCAEFVFNGRMNLLFGETLIKFIFLPLPRELFWKPDSMIAIYTSVVEPAFRSRGGSYPVIIYSELLANFHFFGLVFLFLIFYLFEGVYTKFLSQRGSELVSLQVLLIYLLVTIVVFVRGGGFEIWILSPLISFPLIYLISISQKIRISIR